MLYNYPLIKDVTKNERRVTGDILQQHDKKTIKKHIWLGASAWKTDLQITLK